MSAHEQFEELCALATSGQLTAAEAKALAAHLRMCSDCRSFLSDARFISDKVVLHMLSIPLVESKVPEGMRERFLARAAAHGFHINAGPPIASAPAFAISDIHPGETSHAGMHAVHSDGQHLWIRLCRYWQPVALAACACFVCFALGTRVRLHNSTPLRSVSDRLIATNSNPPVVVSSPASDKDKEALLGKIRELTADRDSLAQQHVQLTSELEAINKEKQESETVLQAKVAALQSSAAHDYDSLTQQTVALNDRALALQSQLQALQQKQTMTDAALAVQEQETQKYFSQAGQLKTQLATLSSVPPMSRDEVQSLVAARNLHIIDVYDSDGEGNRQRAFGRVFYVEGRSLVFYAYDLGKAHTEKKITFHVWGSHANDKETTISLGVLHDEDPAEQRWAMTYSDPKVLAKINSVFVTIEPSNRDVTAPTGKKVLYAFFGEKPNHP